MFHNRNHSFTEKNIFFFTIIATLCVVSCLNDSNTMVAKYNEKFNLSPTPFGEEYVDLNINDPGYLEKQMIPETYIMYGNLDNAAITFSAPEGGTEYRWSWKACSNDEEPEVEYVFSREKTFTITLQDVPWQKGHVYMVFLSVKNKRGSILSDEAYVCVTDIKTDTV